VAASTPPRFSRVIATGECQRQTANAKAASFTRESIDTSPRREPAAQAGSLAGGALAVRAISRTGAATMTVRADCERADADRVERVTAEQGKARTEERSDKSLKPRSFPRSAGIVRSASCAVAATKEKFHPIEPEQQDGGRPGRSRPTAGRIVEIAMTTSPICSAVNARCGRSAPRSPGRGRTSRTRGTDDREDGALRCDGDAPPRRNRSGSSPRPSRPKRCEAASIAGRTPGRRTSSLKRGGRLGRHVVSSPDQLGDPLRVGARDELTSASATKRPRPAASHERSTRRPSRPYRTKSGPKTVGLYGRTGDPRPEQDVGDCRRARSWRGIHVTMAAVRMEERDATRRTDEYEPRDHGDRRSGACCESREGAPARTEGEPAVITGVRPMRSIRRPAGTAVNPDEVRKIAGRSRAAL